MFRDSLDSTPEKELQDFLRKRKDSHVSKSTAFSLPEESREINGESKSKDDTEDEGEVQEEQEEVEEEESKVGESSRYARAPENSIQLSAVNPFPSASGTTAQESSSSTSRPSLSRTQSMSVKSIDDMLTSPLTPFKLQWAFGINISAGALNLTDNTDGLVFYSCANSAFLYNYEESKMFLFQGHKNPITHMDVDLSGRWLVTTDMGEDSAVIVWDIVKRLPICTLFDAHPNGARLVAISDHAKYLVTIGDEREKTSVLKFWLWTYGNDDGDDSYSFKENDFGQALHVTFNVDKEEHFMVTFELIVVFFVWDREEKRLIYHIPTRRQARMSGNLVQSAYLKYSHECVTCTESGCVLMWGLTLYTLPLGGVQLNNEKIFIKTIKIQKEAITCIKNIDKYIATGDVNGFIKFYDNRMEIVYWFQSFDLAPIMSISFDLHAHHIQPGPVKLVAKQGIKSATQVVILEADPQSQAPAESGSKMSTTSNPTPMDATVGDRGKVQIKTEVKMPSGAALGNPPFLMRNFIVVTQDGKVGRVDISASTFEYILTCYNEHPITALDVHNEKAYLCIANAATGIHIYDYVEHKMLASIRLSKTLDIYEKLMFNLSVTTIKFSPEGLHLACGMSNGDVWMLEPVLLTPLHNSPFKKTKHAIQKIAFSLNSKFFAFFDANMLVCAFRYTDNGTWDYLGKIRSHYKPIVDITFTDHLPVRLFTIGEDRIIVEYELYGEPGSMTMTFREQFDQFPVPTCFTYFPRDPKSKSKDHYLIIADDAYKFKFVSDLTACIKSMYLGPTYDSPVKKLVMRKHELEDPLKFMIFHTNRHIGIQVFPTDGNPFKYVGMVGHPNSILDFALSGDGNFLFTAGKGDSTVQMWSVNTDAVLEMEKLGGLELEPFYPLLDGGKEGWLFGEMQDLFYYVQILHQTENPNLPRTVSDYVPISEITDLVRAVGFYPSQFEIYNLITDITYRDYDLTGEIAKVISFHDFVKLYINHRPPFGLSAETLHTAFKTLCKAESELKSDVSREYFIEAMCTLGEPMRPMELFRYLSNVYHFEGTFKEDKHMKFIPSIINYQTFMEDILGIDYSKLADAEEEETFVDVTA